MFKYLGSIYVAVFSLCFIFMPIVMMFFALSAEISIATVVLALMCISCSLLWGADLIKKRGVIFSWGDFMPDGVRVKVLFNDPFVLHYDECNSCGIAYYRHAFLNNRKSALGTNKYYIFLSAEPFDENYRTQINYWMPSNKRIKIGFDIEVYDYLSKWLPSQQADQLTSDYKKYMDSCL